MRDLLEGQFVKLDVAGRLASKLAIFRDAEAAELVFASRVQASWMLHCFEVRGGFVPSHHLLEVADWRRLLDSVSG